MKIHLGVNKSLMGGEISGYGTGVLAELVPSAQSATPPLQVIRAQVPVSGSGATAAIELPEATRSATLFVRVRMPSGELLTQRIAPEELSSESEPTFILRGQSSPNEWLSWATLLGDVPTPRADASLENRLDNVHAQLFVVRPPEPPVEAPFALHHDSDPSLGVQSFLLSLPSQGSPAHHPRYFLLLGLDDDPARQVIAIPGPWLNPRLQPVPIQVLLAREPGADGETVTVVRVLVQDPLVAPILGYLQSGDVASAREAALADGAEELLYAKLDNPLAAAAGGYALLASRAYERLHDWPKNLANGFEWLPDGCVIAAQQYLQAKERARTKEALEYLLRAARRGVPVYTMGLRLLASGLQLFARSSRTRDDPVVQSAANWASELAARARPESIFTVLDIHQDSGPWWMALGPGNR